ncbi:MAG TPA: hypothetical protein ENG70_00455 [Candidatus Cloacimonetes bacterium]|nr:hypothetical protein [Candidatus Cloacimonadota bacterium]HEX37326.1 hypothetical protein [Candidatus Cloacimonadota bacterium]
MNKFAIIIMLLLITTTLFASDEFYIRGLNEMTYVYKNAQDSLKQYFYDEFSFRMVYKDVTFGMKFIAKFPRYNDYVPIHQLSSQDLSYTWDERYLEYKNDGFSLRGGNFKQVFGSGILLSSYQDLDFDIDTRLTGISAEIFPKILQMKALYGVLPNENTTTKNDVVAGVDVQKDFFGSLRLGTSAVNVREWQVGDSYLERHIFGIRSDLSIDWIDLGAEYAYLDQFNGIDKIGHAFYAHTSTYFDKFAFSAAYNNYWNFDSRLNDLPLVNHSNESLYDSPVGKDQQGAMGEIQFMPNDDLEFIANYSEEWNTDWSIRQTDIWLEAVKYFDNSSLNLSFSHLERLDEEIQHWEKEVTPTLIYDFFLEQTPVSIKAEYQYFEKHFQQEKIHHWEPLLQVDVGISNVDLSVIAEYSYANMKEIGKNPLWLGAEIGTELFEDSLIRLFVGKEKGGKVCRNGICKYRSQFNGLRLELITSF